MSEIVIGRSGQAQTTKKHGDKGPCIPVLKGLKIKPWTARKKLKLALGFRDPLDYWKIIDAIATRDPQLHQEISAGIDICLSACRELDPERAWTREECVVLCVHLVREQFQTVPPDIFFREASDPSLNRCIRYFVRRT